MRNSTILLLVTVGCGLAAFPPENNNATDRRNPPKQARVASQDSSIDWPQFRGPGGQGHSTAKDHAITWSETANIKWKRAIEGTGWSSPVIQNNQIWLTSASEKGKSLVVICLDRATGRQRHDVSPFSVATPVGAQARKSALELYVAGIVRLHPKNSYASPTPIIEGNRIYVHFGPYGVHLFVL